MRKKTPQYKLARTIVKMNTGTRVHKAKRGRGAYVRVKKVVDQ